jgi:hypothetical protein
VTKLLAKLTLQTLTHQIQSIFKNESVGTHKIIQLLTVPVETLLEAPEPKASTGGERRGVTEVLAPAKSKPMVKAPTFHALKLVLIVASNPPIHLSLMTAASSQPCDEHRHLGSYK